MNSDKKLDRLFQEKLKNLVVTPPDIVWENIESKLDGKRKKRMLPLHLPSREEILNAKIREFKFVRQEGGGPLPWKIETCSDESNSALDPTPFKGKKALPMDPFRLSAGPTQETGEIWILKAPGGWSHPIHIFNSILHEWSNVIADPSICSHVSHPLCPTGKDDTS